MLNVNRMKGILGDAVSNDVRTLELRVGQIVRGVVLQQYPNNEATVSINGVHVRAKLEVPIMEGQASLLQVQPDSRGGQIHLKQVDPTTIGLQDPMKDILKALNLPDKPWANELVKDLRKEGFALNKETAAAFQRAAQLAPAGVNQEQWMQAAATVFKRGLPMSAATISAIHQLQSGTPAHELLGQLRGLLTVPNNSASPVTNAIISQLASLLEDGAELIRQLPSQSAGIGQSQTSGTGNQAASQQQGGVGVQASQQQSVVSNQAGVQQLSGTGNQAALQQLSGAGSQAASQQQGVVGNQASAQQASAIGNQAGGQQGSAVGTQTGLQQGAGLQATSAAAHSQQASASWQTSESNGLNGQASTTAQSQGSAGQQPVAANQSGVNVPGNGSSLLPQLLKWLGVNYEATLGKQLMQQQGTVSPQMTQSAEQSSLQQVHTSTSQPSQSGAQTATQPPNQPASAAMPMAATTTQPVANAAQLMQQASAEQVTNTTTQQAGQSPSSVQGQVTAQLMLQHDQAGGAASTQQQSTSQVTPLSVQQASVNSAQQELSQVQQQATLGTQQSLQQSSHDNIKSAIIQLLGQPDVSVQVKETAQQLLHAITGQQLMLTAERNHSLFSHITMYIPIKDANNGQTAAVHIQTRRDRRGELDSENCRIVFDLQMKSLGPTLVDMNIVNKIVSLNLWNDHPAVAPIIESLKPEISEALYDHGYMLSSVRATPVPIKEDETVKPEEGRAVIIPPDIDQLSSTRYKGVDFKV
ncbi:hypothetical protein [Paenibacillus sp. FSL W7-1287]|uniref:hypothetical protein n=1 Tax=Paenibacillus sp. FSL W7-1287 TaxID=2954538 RepID=UPI0030FB7067